ncbi:hypothetical protein B0H14DRAFT_3490481 [Mycena olivaceomarginata]|nr:hypothetical protein B0H14DRAFT_3490481 [Mycena olivaceomarginata]
MRFLSTSIAALASLVAPVVASSSKPPFRSVTAPRTGATTAAHPSRFGSGTAPTALNATGGLPEGTYIEYYGNYLEDNFNIRPLPPVPPTSLTIPDISSYPTGSNLFLSVVEEALPGTCPGGVSQPAQYEFTSVSLMVV